MKNKIVLALFLLVLLPMGACDKFLDQNTDPTRSTVSTVNRSLPSAMIEIAFPLGGYPYSFFGGYFAQYWTQSPVAGATGPDRYIVLNSDLDRGWSHWYSGALQDLNYIISEGEKSNNRNYVAIAKFLQAYVFQMLTDLYGDIPFTAAINADNGQLFPTYDSQETVYGGLITLINDGLAKVDLTPAAVYPGSDDLIYGSSAPTGAARMQNWIRFANTLKLKIYLRQARVNPSKAQTGIQALYATNPAFIQTGQDADVKFQDAQFNRNPMFTYLAVQEPFVASKTIIDHMVANNDARIEVFFIPATTGGQANSFVGVEQGKGLNPALFVLPQQTDFSLTSIRERTATGNPGKSDFPVTLISAAEAYFLRAEAAVRGWAAGNPATLYNQGITASFTKWDLAAEAATYITEPGVVFPGAGTVNQKIEAIITQKWVSMCTSQNIEAWIEQRRTGYPVFKASLGSTIGNNLPARLPYPSNEIGRNPNMPAVRNIDERVWWDID